LKKWFLERLLDYNYICLTLPLTPSLQGREGDEMEHGKCVWEIYYRRLLHDFGEMADPPE
jgi:hypothetical protein